MIEASKYLYSLCKKISYEDSTPNNIGLINGDGGKVLFFFNAYNYTRETSFYDNAVTSLNNIIRKINTASANLCFYDGVSEIGWLIENLNENKFIDIDSDTFSF